MAYDYQVLLEGMRSYGSTDDEICVHGLGMHIEQVRPTVVLAPCWLPSEMPTLGEATLLCQQTGAMEAHSWDVATSAGPITFVKTNVGSPVLLEALLCLGVVPQVERVLLLGSCGSLDDDYDIGDVVVAREAVCGDGASAYLDDGMLQRASRIGSISSANAALYAGLLQSAQRVCADEALICREGRTFSSDSIFCQFHHMDEMRRMDCNVIEMEAAACFRGAAMMELPAAALFVVSDSSAAHKSLISGRHEQEIALYDHVRHEIVPRIILDWLAPGDGAGR